MASTETPDRTWLPLVALAVVVAIAIGTLGVDLYIDRQTADRTAQLVDNSLRSIALADDLRYQAYRLTRPGLDGATLSSIVAQIDVDARAYDPLANDPGEPAEWNHLQGLLSHLQHDPSSTIETREIEASIAHLVAINQEAARTTRDEIGSSHERGLAIDAVAGAVTIGSAVVVALALLRALRRRRQLLAIHLASLADRARELEAFASRVSHDLKGPLGPLRAYADVLTIHDAEDVRDVGTRLRRGIDRMTGIVDDVFALSVDGKPAAGSVRVAAVVREVLEELHAELADADVKVTVGDVSTACSAGVLAQVLRNLVTNAAKYRAKHRKLVLRVEARVTGDNVEIAVADNGSGMDSTGAFDPQPRPSGHGIGLSIVRRAVESVGGTVALTSTRNVGTRVSLRLPLALDVRESPHPARPS